MGKKIVSLLMVVVIIGGLAFLGTRLIHKCDACEETFFGTGYEASVVADLLTDEEQIICEDCAEIQHALSILAGKSLDDFKRGLFD